MSWNRSKRTWEAQWREQGQTKRKHFSEGKHGFEKAKQLVKDSGVPTPINITLANFSDAPAPQVSAAMKEALDR